MADGLFGLGGMFGSGKKGKKKTLAELLAAQGRDGDTLIAHINPQEAALLDQVTDGGSINPNTGLLEFAFDDSGAHDFSTGGMGLSGSAGSSAPNGLGNPSNNSYAGGNTQASLGGSSDNRYIGSGGGGGGFNPAGYANYNRISTGEMIGYAPRVNDLTVSKFTPGRPRPSTMAKPPVPGQPRPNVSRPVIGPWPDNWNNQMWGYNPQFNASWWSSIPAEYDVYNQPKPPQKPMDWSNTSWTSGWGGFPTQANATPQQPSLKDPSTLPPGGVWTDSGNYVTPGKYDEWGRPISEPRTYTGYGRPGSGKDQSRLGPGRM